MKSVHATPRLPVVMGKKSKRRGGKRDDERSPNVRNSPSDAVAEMRPVPADPQSINIRVVEVLGEEQTFFRLKRTTQLEKVFNAYAARKGVATAAFQFLFNGAFVGGDDTPGGIGMEDGDQLDCFPRTDDEEDSQAEDDEALARRLQREWEEEDNRPRRNRRARRESGESHRGNRLPVDEATKRDKSVIEFKLRCFETREAVVTDDADGENFDEYMGLILEDKSTARDGRAILHAMERWPRIRKYWPRVRRRICSACGKYTLDLSQPRYFVCGGCSSKGRGVGRYCSEACQAEHWPVHSMNCAYILGPAP